MSPSRDRTVDFHLGEASRAGMPASALTGRTSAEREELARLRREEPSPARQERDILAKAAAWFCSGRARRARTGLSLGDLIQMLPHRLDVALEQDQADRFAASGYDLLRTVRTDALKLDGVEVNATSGRPATRLSQIPGDSRRRGSCHFAERVECEPVSFGDRASEGDAPIVRPLFCGSWTRGAVANVVSTLLDAQRA